MTPMISTTPKPTIPIIPGLLLSLSLIPCAGADAGVGVAVTIKRSPEKFAIGSTRMPPQMKRNYKEKLLRECEHIVQCCSCGAGVLARVLTPKLTYRGLRKFIRVWDG